MTDWAKDLQSLLGNVQRGVANAAEYTPFTAPINDIAAGNFGNVPGEVVGGLFRGLAIPQDVAKYGTGAILGGVNKGLVGLDERGIPLAGWAAVPETARAFEEGGPRAAWEEVRRQETENLHPLIDAPFQIATEIGIDPLTAFGAPLKGASEATKLSALTRSFEQAATNPRNAAAGFVAGTGADLTRGADLLFNRAPWEVTKRVVGPVGKGVKKGIQKVRPDAFEYSPKALVSRQLEEDTSAWMAKRLGEQGLPGLPAVIPGTTKSLSPFDQYDVPPFFDTEFDSGVPSRVKELAWESWQALKMSQPGIPGINAPGQTLNPAGPLRMEAQRPADTGMLGRLRGQFERDLPLGFIQPPPGGYKDPGQVRLDEDNLMHMATIGAAIMLDYDNDVSNRLFGRLIQASEGFRDVKNEISGFYGSGINPFIPGAYDEMARLVREGGTGFDPRSDPWQPEFPGGGDLPDRRFSSEWGWTEGDVGTDRLRGLDQRVSAGKLSRENALKQVRGSGYHAGSNESIQATEAAAGFGAGFLGASREMDSIQGAQDLYNPATGALRPKSMSDVTGRAAVPRAFEQVNKFDINKAAYNEYMTQLFGQMPADELETMRKMSVEIIYNEMLNAAAPWTGGTEAATTFLKKGLDRSKYLDEKGKIPAPLGKMGGFADPNNPRQVGNRADEIDALGPDVKYVVGRPTLKSLNSSYLIHTLKTNPQRETYTLVTGKKAPSSLTNTHLVEMIEKLGGTPFEENKIGGPMPNAQHLVNIFNIGKNLQAGSYPAPEFYDGAAEEILKIVGPGRYEDAMMLVELLGITSAGEGVQANAENALRLFAEWKIGSPDFSRRLEKDFGMTADEVLQLLHSAGEWDDPNKIFRQGIKSGMRELTTRAFNEYVTRRETGSPWRSVQGGPKTHSYAGSTLLNVWRDAIDNALGHDPKMHKVFKDGLDKAAKALAWDRHQNRITELGTEVTPQQSVAMRELALIAADMADISPERFQSGLWYAVKDAQGFTRVSREDDVAMALRRAWQENLPPSRMAEVRELIERQEPGLERRDPDLFDSWADELMRQEGMYAIIEKHLGNREAEMSRMFGEPNPLRALFGMTEDTLGIVNRANNGAPPKRTPNVFELYDLTKATLGQVRQGKGYGATFGWDGYSWGAEEPADGFAVALTSAGASVSTAKPKTAERALEKLVTKYTTLIDDPRYANKIKFGTFQMDDVGKDASIDLTLVVPDERTAVGLAKKFNQKAIYDFAAGDVIQTGGTGDPVDLSAGELRKILDSLYGSAGVADDAFKKQQRRGLYLAEANPFNPTSIINRRVLGPIMEAFHTKSVQTLPGGNGTNPVDIGLPGPVPDDTVFDFASIGQDWRISTQQNAVLNKTSDDGVKVGDKLDAYFAEARADTDYVEQSPRKWGANAGPAERLKAVEGDVEMTKIVKKYNDLGIDPAYARPEAIATSRHRRDIAKAKGVDPDHEGWYDLFKAAWGEQALASIKYHTGNIQGGIIQNALAGTITMPNPQQFGKALKYIRAGRDGVSRTEALHDLHAYQTFQKWGFDDLPSWLNKGGVRGQLGTSDRSATGRLVTRVTNKPKLGNAVGTIFAFSADLSSAGEVMIRGSLAEDVLDREMMSRMPAFEQSLQAMAAKQGLDGFEFSILDTINPVPGGPTPRRLKDHLQRLGFNEGYAERGARNYAEAKNAAENIAKAETDRVQFSYDRTNLDEWAANFIPFAYWPSRALRYYGENALRYPYLLENYMRAQDGVEDAQSDPGLSARQKGFLKLMVTPLGFTLLMNPDAMIGIVRFFGLDDYEDPEDTEISAGKIITALKNRGVGLYPWIDGTLNLMGVLGDTYEPDLLGIRHKALIGSAVNFARSQLGMDPAGTPYASAMGSVRGSISGFVSQFTPDWLTQPVTPRVGGSLAQASLDTIIESRIMARNPGMTNGQLLDIMSDPDSPEYDAAYRDVSANGLVQQLLNFTLPQTYRLEENTRDVRSAQVSTIYEAAEKQGVSPYEFKPSIGDVAFGARYKELTGKDWRPGDYETAQAKQKLTRAAPEAKNILYQAAEYQDLGTTEQQRRFTKYQDILNGTTPQTQTLDYQTRKELANAWASKLGYTEDIANVYRLRTAWEQSHPEYAQYKGWSDQMWSLYNTLGGSLAEYRRQASQQNPNAQRYFADKEREIRSRYPSEEVGKEMDSATVSVDAWAAITGLGLNRYDEGPIPGVPPADLTLPTIQNQVLNNQPVQNTDWMQNLQGVSPGFGADTYGTWWNH